MATDDYTGSYVRIVTPDGKYEGYIHRVDLCNEKLSLERVVLKDSETERQLQGIHHFYGQELASLEILKDVPAKKIGYKEDPQKEYGQTIMGKGYKHQPAHLQKLRERDLLTDLPIPSKERDRGEDRDTKGNSGYDSGIDQEAGQSVVSKFPFTVIDKLESQTFKDALVYINDQTVIGVALEGIDMGRDGELCWIQMATSDHVFLFDVKTLGRKCISEGLKSILESAKILKVMHNCRFPSDILWHQFQVKLVNIFDTQVADVFVYRNCHAGDCPRYVHGLPIILMEYLELSINEIHIMKVRKSSSQADEAFWAERPASQKVIDAAIKDVVYLRQLRRILIEKMLSEYTAGVDLFLNHARGASKSALPAMKSGSHLLPTDFQELSLSVHNMSNRKHFQKDWVMKDTHGFRENVKWVPKSLHISREISMDIPSSKACNDICRKSPDTLEMKTTSPLSQGIDDPALDSPTPLTKRSASPVSVTSDSSVVSIGRGSRLLQISSEPVPGVTSIKKTQVETKSAGQKPDWDSLIQTEPQTDLTGIILKPAGIAQSSNKSPSNSDFWRSSIQDEESKWDAKCQLTKEKQYLESFHPDRELEEDCFDAIPSHKPSAKVALPSGQHTSSFSDFESISFDTNLEFQNASSGTNAANSNSLKNRFMTGSLPCLVSTNVGEKKRRPVCPRLPHHVSLNRKTISEDSPEDLPSALNKTAELVPIEEIQTNNTVSQFQNKQPVSVQTEGVTDSSSEDKSQTECNLVNSTAPTPSINTANSLLKLKSLMEQLKARKQTT